MIKSSINYLDTRYLTLIIGLVLSVPQTILGQDIFKDEQNRYARVRQARESSGEKIDSLFCSKDINYPPNEILIVAYKKEQILELWAQPETLEMFTLVKQYPFTAFSGILGPKRKQGDLQIPEGFYYINHFNPVSAFHLSLRINYPNRSDVILGERANLGGEIRIHGSAVTIGCIPIGNEAIEELYIICVDTKSAGQEDIPVYIFPCHMDSLDMAFLKVISESDIEVFSFWQNLKKGYDIFDKTHKELKFGVDDFGNYVFLNKIYNNSNSYAWHTDYNNEHTLVNRIGVPEGFTRILSTSGSFEDWLRYLSLKEGNPPVFLYNGTKKSYQEGHHAVIDIDIGTQDLQQCADAIIRLYAEYLYSHNNFDKIEFRLTNGDFVGFRKWISGYRPRVHGNRVTWHEQTQPDSSYENFKRYLIFIFTYAGTYSLSQQLRPVADIVDMEIGDIFIQGGFPGHAVMVVDMARHIETGQKIFLLCQSFMPAQDIHILKNLHDIRMNPWYRLEFGDSLYTPEWIFTKKDLKRF